jgi:glutamate-1-semialdehyde 2,1-aminomutase
MSKQGLQGSTAATTAGSKKVYERTRDVLIEGGSSSSRGPVNFGEYPIFMREGNGSRLIDVDGNEYIDWMMGFGALPLGHADPRVADAIAYAARTGAHFASATPIEVEVAEAVQRMVPNAERVRFANTGTEAVMAAVRLARGVTGRPKLLKFEGHYHGWYDDLLVSSNPMPVSALGLATDPVKIADSSGLNRHALDDTIVVPWNDVDALRRAIGNHPGQIAAIITEGIMTNMGVIAPDALYLEALQQLAREHGILFLLDETVTGFRVAPGGCQQRFGLDPDIVTFGKALGCGLPVAAFVGRAKYMDALAWGGVLHYGTQNGSRIGMFAAQANLQALNENDGAVFRHIEAIATRLCDGLTRLFEKTKVPAIVQRVGPIFQIMFTRRAAIRNYRDFCGDVDRIAYRQFVWKLFEYGVYMTPAATLHSLATAAHTEDDVAQTLEGVERALNDLYC